MRRKLVAIAVMATTLFWGSGLSATALTPSISPTLKSQLKYLVEEEKLARDVYTSLAAVTNNRRFVNIAKAEQVHMNEVAAILKAYGVWNPTLTRSPGVFYNKALANLYQELVAKGSQSLTDAYAVGVQIEEADLADLEKMIRDVTQPDIKFMLNALKTGSANHLAAFKRY